MVTPLNSLLTFGFQRSAVAEALAYLRAPLDALNPGRGLSLREIGRQLGINESTLRTAFYTPGRGPSQRTLDRISAGFGRTDLLVQRTNRNDIFTETARPGSNADTFMTFDRPAGATAWRIVVLVSNDPKYTYKALGEKTSADINPFETVANLGDDESFDRIIWYTGGGVILE
jgi:hypothetical protein